MDSKSTDAKARQMVWIEPLIKDALNTALQLRRKISTTPERDVRDIEAKTRLLAEAEEAMELVKLGGYLLIATTLLSNSKSKETLKDAPNMEDYSTVVSSYQDARKQKFTEFGKSNGREAFKEMREVVDELLKERRPFHWPLEFPEAFAVGIEEERGFAAIVSNPPFQGAGKIMVSLGSDYREYLVDFIAENKRGSADLCTYFVLRAGQLVPRGGLCGLLATNTIAQGDTRVVGLDQMIAFSWTIIRAVSSRKWPGTASLEVAHVWMIRGDWLGPCLLNEKPATGITSFLTVQDSTIGNPYRLLDNERKAFKGHNVYGMGFVLEPKEALALLAKNSHNRYVLFPFLNGEDLNSRSDQSPSRWIINFQDWSLERAEAYPDCMQIVRERVKPERDLNNRPTRREQWWRYGDYAKGLESKIVEMKRVLVITIVTLHFAPTFCPTGWVYAHRCCIFPTEEWTFYSVIQSNIHEVWARQYSSSLENRLNYSPTDCFDTFPFPNNLAELDLIGEQYHQHRQSIMLARQEGLTKTYNRFHNPHETAEDIMHLRELHREMDKSAAQAYGWDDLDLRHGFHETRQGLRFTISEAARREVLGRLLKLNHERYAEEVAQGLHEKGAKARKKGKRVAEEKARYAVGEQGELGWE